MVLFSATSVYHLLEFMVLKYKKYEHEKVTLFISEAIYRRYNNIYSLNIMFDRIIIFNNYAKFTGKVPDTLVPYFDNLFNEHNIVLKDYKDIYIAGAQHSMGIYMLQIKHNFIFLEEASGEVSKPHFLENIEAKLQPGKEEFCKKNGLYNAENPLIKKIICNFKTQADDYIFTDRHVDFDVINELKQIKSDYKNNIINFFIRQTINNNNDNKTILFTQQFANLKIHTYNHHCLIYQIFVDYLLNNDKIIIKKHPMDNMNYNSFLSNVDVLQENFPSELIPLIYYNKNNKIATISSTSVNSLQPYFNQTISLDNEYGMTNEFLETHKYYLISFIINTIFKEQVNIYINGYTNVLFKFFVQTKSVTYTSKLENANIIILDNYIDSQINIDNSFLLNNAIVIFPCSKSKYIPINNINRYSSNIIPLVIKKKIIQENMNKFYSNTEDEIIYLYSNNRDITNLIKRVKMNKKLQNTGIELETKILTEDEIRIKVLEGIIDSLENKLEYVLNENKNLKEKLNIKE